jgi:hypothetical protein
VSATVEILRRGRALYAAHPSHAPFEAQPEVGCQCLVTAVGCDPLALLAIADAAPFKMFNTNEGAIRWNAEHTTEEVLAAIDRAIELAESAS